jgi:hypothetical protein
MRLSKNLGDYTVKQYMDFVKVFKQDHEDQLAKNIALMSVLTGKSEEYYNSIPTKQLMKEVSKLPVFSLEGLEFPVKANLRIKLRIFKGITDCQDLSSDRYRDIKGYMERGIDSNLHNLLACVYSPYFNRKYTPKIHKEVSDIMLTAKIKDVCGLVFFYADVFKRLKEIIEISLEMDLKNIEKMMKEAQNLLQPNQELKVS